MSYRKPSRNDRIRQWIEVDESQIEQSTDSLDSLDSLKKS